MTTTSTTNPERPLRADAQRNREKVLRAARDAFAASGYGVPLDEIAALVCWLSSAECSFSTGAAFDISGGRATY